MTDGKIRNGGSSAWTIRRRLGRTDRRRSGARANRAACLATSNQTSLRRRVSLLQRPQPKKSKRNTKSRPLLPLRPPCPIATPPSTTSSAANPPRPKPRSRRRKSRYGSSSPTQTTTSTSASNSLAPSSTLLSCGARAFRPLASLRSRMASCAFCSRGRAIIGRRVIICGFL